MTPPGPMRLRHVADGDALAGMAETWERTLEDCETRSPFLTHEWVLSWWESFGSEQQLCLLVCEDELGVAGLAPFALARRRLGPFTYSALELIGTGPLPFLGMGLADRADLLLTRRAPDCVEAIFNWLENTKLHWDVVDLRFVPEDSTTVHLLQEGARTRRLGFSRTRCSDSPYLPLQGTLDEYLATRGRSFRKGIRRQRKALEGMGRLSFVLDGGEEGRGVEALEAAMGVSAASWKGATGTALLSHAAVRDFFELLFPRLAAVGGVFVSLLEVDGLAVAHELGFRRDGKLWSYDSCFRSEFREGSPGVILTLEVLGRAWSEGLSEYDFLRGGEYYKLQWKGGIRSECQIVVAARTLRGRLARRLAYEAKWILKRVEWLVDAQSRAVGLLNRMRGSVDDRTVHR